MSMQQDSWSGATQGGVSRLGGQGALPWTGLVAASLLVGGCGDAESTGARGSGPEAHGEVVADEPPPKEIYKDGRRFVRRDQLSEAEFERVVEQAEPSSGERTVEEVAHQLRAHMLRVRQGRGTYYVEAEPNYELAKSRIERSDNLPQVSDGRPPRKPRRVYGTDQRADVSSYAGSYPWSAYGLMNAGLTCSGQLIGPNTAYTAAHCAYDNNALEWKCPGASNESGDGDLEYGEDNACNANPITWWFGIDGTNTQTGAIRCFDLAVPNAYAGNSSIDPAVDYLAVDFSDCSTRPGDQVGWLGYRVSISDSKVNNTAPYILGYPQFAPCDDGDLGTPSDCSGNSQWGPGAQLWGFTGTAGDAWADGAQEVDTKMDLTNGNSGSGIAFQDNADDPTTRRVYGVWSTHGATGGSNNFNKFGWDEYYFFTAFTAIEE